MKIEFEWDERKRRSNLHTHGLDFVEAKTMFQSPMIVALGVRQGRGEDRYVGLGMSRGRVLVIACTQRSYGQTVRVISLRKALKHEQAAFEEIIKD